MDPSDIITVSRSGTTNTAALPKISKANIYKHNLVTLLGAIQSLEIDFLPITWQSAMDDVGRGATAKIRQSLLSLQTSLAFKCIRPSPFSKRSKKAAEEAETKVFHAIISEMEILALTRDHPNIATLYGICWDISKDGQPWPVLVFKKAPHGNLDDFISRNTERELSWVTKVKLVTGIARAVKYMHAHSKVKHSTS
jgi:serine/threonine protein kinase